MANKIPVDLTQANFCITDFRFKIYNEVTRLEYHGHIENNMHPFTKWMFMRPRKSQEEWEQLLEENFPGITTDPSMVTITRKVGDDYV